MDGGMAEWSSRVIVVVALWSVNPALAQATSFPTFYGETGQFIEVEPKRTAPNISFLDGNGTKLSLSRFLGRALLVNIWATWCAPCVRELPALERLQEDLGGRDFAVVAISIDAAGQAAVAPFYEAIGVDDLAIFLDPRRETLFGSKERRRDDAFPLYGLPMSFFVDRDGVLVGYLVGGADWDAEALRSFIDHLKAWRP
jgi:thiol-disulfide isomerase/thioredoxin